MKLEVFDPPMCCSSGVCGPKVNPALPRFAADLEWLKSQGVAVARHNLAQQPLAFAENDAVKTALTDDETCLPLVLVDGQVVCRGRYPGRQELAGFAGVRAGDTPIASEKQKGCCGGVAAGNKRSKCCG